MTVIALLWTTWLLYIAGMAFKRVWPDMHISARVLAAPAIFAALALDVLVNVLVGTVVFVERPREWLLTHRLRRLKAEGTDYQRKLAGKICKWYLNQFDPRGDHC